MPHCEVMESTQKHVKTNICDTNNIMTDYGEQEHINRKKLPSSLMATKTEIVLLSSHIWFMGTSVLYVILMFY